MAATVVMVSLPGLRRANHDPGKVTSLGRPGSTARAAFISHDHAPPESANANICCALHKERSDFGSEQRASGHQAGD
jgi:hypothetical protein